MRITVNIPEDLEQQIKAAARRGNISMSSFVAAAVEHYLAADQRRKAAQRVLNIVDGKGVAADALKELKAGRRQGARA